MALDLAGRAPVSSGEPLTSVVGTRGTEPKGHRKLVDLWSIQSFHTLINHSHGDEILILCCRIITYVPVADARHPGQMK